MGVHENSRFKGNYILLDEDTKPEEGGTMYLSPFRENIYDPELGDLEITFEQGMRVDLLAYDYYGDESLEWVIMDANPQFFTPRDIQVGEQVIIPNPKRVMNSV